MQTLTKQPFLNLKSTLVGIQNDQWEMYSKVRSKFANITYIRYDNPGGSTVVAREHLRRSAVAIGFKRYVCADDNTQYTQQSLVNLVQASLTFKKSVVVGGMQGSLDMNAKPSRFDEAYVKKSGFTKGGMRFYRKIGMMFWVFPHELYSKVQYCAIDYAPLETMGCMEDHSIALALLRTGFTNFVVCMDAPFIKKRFQPGGSGSLLQRAQKIGMAWIRLGRAHPDYMAHVRMIWPYAKFYKMAKQRILDEDIPF